MSDPQPDRLKPRPPRADPLQPDKPGSGDTTEPSSDGSGQQADPDRVSPEQKEQNETAHENVRNGYS